jgi:hypothetical protein
MISGMVADGSMESLGQQYGHARLAADEPDGRVVREVVPVMFLEDGLVEIIGSPALVMGCVAGDVVRMVPDGHFEIMRRGPNLSVQAFSGRPLMPEAIQQLTDAFAVIGGIVEAPADGKFLVATIPAAVGRSAIDAIMNRWSASFDGLYWQHSAPAPPAGQDPLR